MSGALTRTCPSCGALPGQPCKRLLPGPHKARQLVEDGGLNRNPHPARQGVKGKRGPRNPAREK